MSGATRERSWQATIVGDSDASEPEREAARAIGRGLAERDVVLVTGGRGGVMEAASRGALEAGGLAVAILPGTRHQEAHPWSSIVVPTGLGHARNLVNVLAGDLVIAVGGGAGTLSELCFAWIHGRPILALAGFGGWSERLAGQALDGRATSVLVECASVREVLDEVDRLRRG